MSVKIYESKYKDKEAITLESSDVVVQFLPSIGAKMPSMVYKPKNCELLVQRPGAKYLMQPFDGDFVAGECSGFDDMFPTISECYYESYPWKGTKMADHGEVWSFSWEYSEEKGGLHFSTYGVRFPYRLEKWAQFVDDGILRIDYRVTNNSEFDFDFLWAAHTMFSLIEEGVELVLPPGINNIVSTLSFNGDLGKYGDEFPWPIFTSPNGKLRDLSKLRSKSTKDAEKYFIKGRMPEGWCGLRYLQSDFSLFLSFPVEKVPYLAILPNENGWQNLYNIFLEPCTASFDRLDVARLHNEFSTVKSKSTYEWHLNITLAGGTNFHRADVDGRLDI